MKKKKIIRFAIILFIFLAIFLIVYTINVLSSNQEEFYEEKAEESIPYEMSLVNEYSYFFSVVNILNSYLDDLKDENTEALLNVLHTEYLNSYQINEYNIYEHLDKLDNGLNYTFKANIMAYKTDENLNRYLYYVKGDIIENGFEENKVFKKDVMFLVNVDYENITYAIYPLNYLYEILPIINPYNEILKNVNNELIGSNVITKDYICNLYLSDFIEKVSNNVEDSYDLLDSDFRKKEFAKKSKYIEYMNNNKNKLSYQIYECSSLSGNSNVYEIKDMNFNTYIFTEESIMNYKVEFTIN